MPPFREVKGYLGGLWLLVKGDERGLARFDVSDEGMNRSFWAFAYALPAMALYWIINRSDFVHVLGDEAEPFITFMAKMLLVEIISWGLTLVVLMLATHVFNRTHVQRILVIVWNWLTMVTLYFSYGIVLPISRLPSLENETAVMATTIIFATLMLIALIAFLVGTWRILRIIIGGNPLVRLVMLLTANAASRSAEPLERFFGVYSPW